MDNKKVLGISIAAVLVLVVAIIATSYAVFTANLTGTKENTLNTGYVTMDCAETTFNLEDTVPMSDTDGIAASDNAATCQLTSTMVGTMTVGYDVALAEVDSSTPDDSIGENEVKIQAYKSIDSGTTQYLAGTSSNAGVTVASIKGQTGQYDTSITNYKLDSATVTGNHTINYTIKAWVASEGTGSNSSSNSSSNNDGVCSDIAYSTEETCEAAGEIWGTSQTECQTGGSFSFKLKIGATQVLS